VMKKMPPQSIGPIKRHWSACLPYIAFEERCCTE
jgi:hypothetical protein